MQLIMVARNSESGLLSLARETTSLCSCHYPHIFSGINTRTYDGFHSEKQYRTLRRILVRSHPSHRNAPSTFSSFLQGGTGEICQTLFKKRLWVRHTRQVAAKWD